MNTASFKTMTRQIPWVLGVLCFFCGMPVHGASQQEAQSRLDRARMDLSISEATESRIVVQLELLKQSGNASPDVIRDYETYLDRVHRMVIENRRIVEEMEAALGRYETRQGAPGTSDIPGKEQSGDQKIPEAEVRDDVAVLDGEFYASLAAFDEMLLKEMDAIRAKSAGKMRDLAQEAAEAARRVREKGVDVDTRYQERTGKGEGEQADPEKGKEAGGEQGESGAGESSREPWGEQRDSGEGDSRGPGGEPSDAEKERAKARGEDAGDRTAGRDREYDREPGPGKSGPDTRKDRPPAYDDDIVARQIREAAEKETDPELKARLWKEYENYKRGSSQ